MVSLVVLDFAYRYTVSVEGLFETADRPFRLLVILHNVTLKPMHSPPVDPPAVIVVTAQIHLDWRPSWHILSASRPKGGPDTTLEVISSFTVMMSVRKSF